MSTEKKIGKDIFTFDGIVKIIKANWPWFLASILLFGILGGLYIYIKPKYYETKANVVIAQDNSQSSMMSEVADLGVMFGSAGNVDDEIFIISSHAVYKNVAKNLGVNKMHWVREGLKKKFMYKGYPVEIYPQPGMLDTLAHSLKFKIKVDSKERVDITMKFKYHTLAKVKDATFPVSFDTPYGNFLITKTDAMPVGEPVNTSVLLMGYDDTAEYLATTIKSVIPSRRSNVISLSMISPSTPYAKAVLNEVISEYNRRGIEVSNQKNQKTESFIDERISLVFQDLNDTEKKIQEYQEKHGSISLTDLEYNYKIRSEVETRLFNAQTQGELMSVAEDFLSNPDNAYELIPTSLEGIHSLQGAIAAYNTLIMKRIRLLNNAKDNNMALTQVIQQIDASRKNIQESIAKARKSNEVLIGELTRKANSTLNSFGNMPEHERMFTDLYRERQVKAEIYVFLLKRREETAMMIANAIPKAEIIDEAYQLSEPAGRSPIILLGAFLFLGFCLPLGLFIFLRMIRTKFNSREEVENMVDVPVLGEVALEESSGAVIANSRSSNAELFRLMRANLQFVLNGTEDKVVLVTSTTSGEGKSFVSVNLAASLALLDKKVLLIGMDIRKPMLAEYLNITDSQKGLTQYLSSPDVKLEDIICHEPNINNLDVITAGPIPPNPAELLNSQVVDELFVELRKMYDYIIVDTAPVGMVSDTFTLDRIADAAIYVVRINCTLIKDLKFVDTIYNDARLKKLSLVVNGTKLKKGYGYGYGNNHK